jgi:uncharacterized membrane protein
MFGLHAITGAGASRAEPNVRRITLADVKEAALQGLADFLAMPTHLMFLAIIYPLVGLFLARFTFGYQVLPLLFPLVAGYALIGPFAAIGLYEMSRQREQRADISWQNAFDVFKCPSLDAIAALGMIMMIVFLAWLVVAMWLYRSLYGAAEPVTVSGFLYDIFTTSRGWMLIIVGHMLGFPFAVLALVIGVVSFPMLIDRDVGAVTAVRTSVRAVLLNPVPMTAWGLLVAVALAAGSLPFFVGLAVVMPVLAHASWHLYRKVVER